MREIDLEKVTINICVGQNDEKILKASKLIEKLTGMKPYKCRARKTIRDFGISKNKVIALKVTLRRDKAREFLEKALYAVNHTLSRSQFDENGNFSFGIKEYMDIKGVKYDHEIGVLGMDVCVTLKRKGGWRVKYRKKERSKIGSKHRITKDEAIDWVSKTFNVNIE